VTAPTADSFTSANALSTLLTTESLLFAAFSLAVSLSGPTNRVRAWLVPGSVLAGAAVAALAGVGAGGIIAWHDLFVEGGFSRDATERVIAIAILGAIVIQPLLALLLALGLRTRE
jgi:hypothetical protein